MLAEEDGLLQLPIPEERGLKNGEGGASKAQNLMETGSLSPWPCQVCPKKTALNSGFENNSIGTSLVVQWLGLCTPNAEGAQVGTLVRKLDATHSN